MNYVRQVNGIIPPPRSYQMELTWGCNLRCWFCGIHEIPVQQQKFMLFEVAEEFGKQVNAYTPKTRIEFGTGGESTLHPQFLEIVQTLRQHAPQHQLMAQTNTQAWATAPQAALDFMNSYFEAGGNILVLNCYVKGTYEFFQDVLRGSTLHWVDFYYDNPQRLSPYHYHGPRERLIFLSQDLGLMSIEHQVTKQKVSQRWLNNQGGSTPEAAYRRVGKPLPQLPLQQSCNVPFLQLVLNWDGTVPTCCYDWTDRLLHGSFPHQSLREIWESRTFQIMRTLLARKDRSASPCDTCDFHGGFRKGLTIAEPPDMGDSAQLHAELETLRVARPVEQFAPKARTVQRPAVPV